jgi:hypothetical protein
MRSPQYSNSTNKALTLREGSKITPGPWMGLKGAMPFATFVPSFVWLAWARFGTATSVI